MHGGGPSSAGTAPLGGFRPAGRMAWTWWAGWRSGWNSAAARRQGRCGNKAISRRRRPLSTPPTTHAPWFSAISLQISGQRPPGDGRWSALGPGACQPGPVSKTIFWLQPWLSSARAVRAGRSTGCRRPPSCAGQAGIMMTMRSAACGFRMCHGPVDGSSMPRESAVRRCP